MTQKKAKQVKGTGKDHVMRFNDANWLRFHKLKPPPEMVMNKKLKKLEPKKVTDNQMLGMLLDAYETLKESKVQYAARLYDDVAEARGEAILWAVKHKQVPTLPKVVAVVGEDHG